MCRKFIDEKKLRKEYVVMGLLGTGAVGHPSSSTSGRQGSSRTLSCCSGFCSGDEEMEESKIDP